VRRHAETAIGSARSEQRGTRASVLRVWPSTAGQKIESAFGALLSVVADSCPAGPGNCAIVGLKMIEVNILIRFIHHE
jgi:hypothetical protein